MLVRKEKIEAGACPVLFNGKDKIAARAWAACHTAAAIPMM
jgi:hypothetical protein